MEKDWPTRLLIASYTRLEKRLWWGRVSWGRGSPCPCTLGDTRVPASQAAVPPSCSALTGAKLTEAKKWSCTCACRAALVVSNTLQLCGLCPSRLLCRGGRFSRQEHWRVLANTGCHARLEHCISCCPSRQHPWEPGAARTPATQAAAPPPHLASQGKPKASRAASVANPSGRPTCRGGNKATVETQGECGKEEDPKFSHQLCKVQVKSTQSARQTVSMEYVKGRWELLQKKIH